MDQAATECSDSPRPEILDPNWWPRQQPDSWHCAWSLHDDHCGSYQHLRAGRYRDHSARPRTSYSGILEDSNQSRFARWWLSASVYLKEKLPKIYISRLRSFSLHTLGKLLSMEPFSKGSRTTILLLLRSMSEADKPGIATDSACTSSMTTSSILILSTPSFTVRYGHYRVEFLKWLVGRVSYITCLIEIDQS